MTDCALSELSLSRAPCYTRVAAFAQTGLPPFYDEDVNIMYQRILSDPLLFPPDMPPDAMSVITGLLQRDPSKRLGSNGAEEIKRHPFFSKHIDWNRYVPAACLEDWRARWRRGWVLCCP